MVIVPTLGDSLSLNFYFYAFHRVRDDVKVSFSKSSTNSSLPDHYIESERQMKEMKWRKEKMLEDITREQAMLDSTRLNFERKKADFVKFIAETATRVSSEPTSQTCST